MSRWMLAFPLMGLVAFSGTRAEAHGRGGMGTRPGGRPPTMTRPPMTPAPSPVTRPPLPATPGSVVAGRPPNRPPPTLDRDYFDSKDYHGATIDELVVLVIDTLEESVTGQAVPIRRNELGGWDLMTNGTFYEGDANVPLGPIFQDGTYLGNHEPKAEHRGAVIVLQDGTILVSRTHGANEQALVSQFGSPSNSIQQLIGGGAVLIENGEKVDVSDLIGPDSAQKFPAADLQSDQFRPTNHTVVATRDGDVYILQNYEPKSGQQLQDDLMEMQVETAVKFDGGSGFVYNGKTPWGGSNPGDRAGRNPTGMAIKTK